MATPKNKAQRKVRVAKPKRLELRFVNYAEGDKLVREGWTLAKEEDHNLAFGMVYLERLEKSNRRISYSEEQTGT